MSIQQDRVLHPAEGTTVNMDGTAMFECAGGLFIAQAVGFDLTMMEQEIVVLTRNLARR